ncbi:MAG: site-2 protease family protein, partial [SAR202 cluster bacterium]|nr:site-2 protease family protein [SAR202 cluster bacterium]
MIFRNLDVLSQDPGAFLLFTVFLLTALVASLTVHEFSHALVATSLGDDTAKRLGRLSLDPRVHLDPTGSLMILLAGFGWGKPVPVNPR